MLPAAVAKAVLSGGKRAMRTKTSSGRLPRFVAAIAVLSALSAPRVASAQGAPGGAARRINDVVILRGRQVSGMLGARYERIGAFAVKNGRLDPAPFQIDERDRDGALIYTTYGGGTTGKRRGALGPADEILFLYRDAGEKRGGEPLPAGAVEGAEITVSDPLGGPERRLYLFAFEKTAPRSETDYVTYDPRRDWVTSPYYVLGFPYRKAIQVPSFFALTEAAGGDGRNIYDLYKLRLTLDLKLLGEATWTQDDFSCTPVGYVDGPVRVSRRVKSALRLAGPFHSATIDSDSAYYPYHCEFPSLLQIPFPLSAIARSVTMRITDDLSPEAKGMTWCNERNRSGIAITGKPGGEAALDSGPYRWKLAHGPQGTIMTLTIFDPGMAMIGKKLFYSDDEATPDEPCQFKGQIANSGYTLTSIESMPKGNYTFTVYVFCPVRYVPGGEQAYLDSVLHPLAVSVAVVPAAEAGAASPRP